MILVAQVRLVALMLVPYTYFCKVRRADDTWRRSYFDLLEHAKTTPMTFSAALRASTTGL